jgi:hypothetical protein
MSRQENLAKEIMVGQTWYVTGTFCKHPALIPRNQHNLLATGTANQAPGSANKVDMLLKLFHTR